MSRDEIITKLVRDGTVDKMCNTFTKSIGRTNMPDFQQEMWLTVLEIPEPKITKLYDDGALEFYILTVIKNQATNPLSKYNKTYNNPIEITDYDIEQRGTEEDD